MSPVPGLKKPRGGSTSNLRVPDDDPTDTSAKALYDYAPVKGDEIPLREGDIITVFRQGADGWWRGTVDGKKAGFFPSNYVESCASPAASGESRGETTLFTVSMVCVYVCLYAETRVEGMG